MRARFLPLLLFVLAGAAASAAVWAQDRGSGIQRCERADGTQVYTDQDCGAFGASPAPLEGELLARLANDGGARAALPRMVNAAWSPPQSSARRTGAAPLPTEPAPRRAPARVSPRGCARSPTQLVMELQAAWIGADVNRLAALYHWAGSDNTTADSVMPRLQSMAAQPLHDIRHYGGAGGSLVQLASAGPAPLGGVIQVHVGSGERTRTHEFQVVNHQGCHFVRF